MHKSRKLLSVDTAEFSNMFVQISVHDPVFSFNTGTFIARKDGLELFETIGDSRQFVLPKPFNIPKDLNNLRLSHKTVAFYRFCDCAWLDSLLEGLMHFLHGYAEKSVMHVPHLPVHHLWFVTFVTGFLLSYIRYTLAAAFSMIKTVMFFLYGIYRFIRACFHLSPANGSDGR